MERVTAKAAEWLAQPNNTKIALCEMLDITMPTLNKRLQGKSKWTFSDAQKIATLTGCTLNDLAGI
jgi:hypothetical protein